MNNYIEPTIRSSKNYCESLQQISEKYNISKDTLVELLNNYMTTSQLNDFEKYVMKEVNYDSEHFQESQLLSENDQVDNLIDNIPTSALKAVVNKSGVKLNGSESDDEVKGMAKALASTNESLSHQKSEEGETKNALIKKFNEFNDRISSASSEEEFQDCLREFENAGLCDTLTNALHVIWNNAHSNFRIQKESRHSKFLK